MAMAQGRRRHDWAQTSFILAMMASAASGEAFSPDRFDPTILEQKPKPRIEYPVSILRDLFCGKESAAKTGGAK